MSNNNLRIIYNNVADNSTLSASTTSSAAYTINNTKLEAKGVVYRSTNTLATINLSWSTVQDISAIVLPFTNLTSTATIRVRLYSDSAFATQILDTGVSLAAPGILPNYYTALFTAKICAKI